MDTMHTIYGNAVIGQSGGPTAAINATLAGVIRGALAHREIDKVYGAVNGIEGLLNGQLTLLNPQFEDEHALVTLQNTPAAALGSCRKKLPDPDADPALYEKLLAILEKYDIRYFFYIGGNDSMDTVAKLSAYAKKHGRDLRVMGVPKTIDNDLECTDHTPGYGSAAKYIACSMQEILRDCEIYPVTSVTIVEIMGRDAGWLTAAAGILRRYHGISPDCIYLPERVFSFEKFGADIEAAMKKHRSVVIAVSEGVRFADGHYVGEGRQSGAVDVFGHQYLSGTGKVLELWVKEKFGCKVRSVEVNILQRCASHMASKTDIDESVLIGRRAVDAAVNGETGKMMCFRRVSDAPYAAAIDSVDVSAAANKVRCVPDAYITDDGSGITDACIDYILPLCEGETGQEYLHGMPVHFVIDKTTV